MDLIILREKALNGAGVSRDEAMFISSMEGPAVFDLFSAANAVREARRGKTADLCSIINAKSGACPEDCSYCAQSARARSGAEVYPLMDTSRVLQAARSARENGARRFCIVTSGRKPSKSDLDKIASMIADVKSVGLLPCATLGILDPDELAMLRDAGLHRYHHNLEASERFFPEVCGTHSYKDKLVTIRAALDAGLSVCSGGIFGLGEEWEDRVDMALALRELGVDSVPINFLIPVEGTALEGAEPLPPLEALKIISLYRLVLPDKELRICGGRPQTLGELGSMVFMAGADGLLIGNYLTANGRSPEDDLRLIKEYGLTAC